ncbi:MAG: hypothetical protein WC294_03465 [Methanoregula sp.]
MRTTHELQTSQTGYGCTPCLQSGVLIFELIALVLALTGHFPSKLLTPVALALLWGLGVMGTTALAAPVMLRLGKTENKEELVTPLLERFVKINYLRAVFIWFQWVSLLWALYEVVTVV